MQVSTILVRKRKFEEEADVDAFFALHAHAIDAAMRAAEAARKARRVQLTSIRVISGGQTGADRAALEAARSVNVPTGGTAPQGFVTAKGRDPSLRQLFGLNELILAQKKRISVGTMYALRSQRNVDDANATVAFRLQASVGTDKTIGYAITGKWRAPNARELQRPEREHHKPCLVIRALDDIDAVAQSVAAFVRRTGAQTINVCGHRNDETAGKHGFSRDVQRVIRRALELLLRK